jgi:hypothetical protein
MIEKLSDDERIYQMAIGQRLDPARAVTAHRRVQAIADADEREGVRRQLTGVVLPTEDDAGDLLALVGRTRGEQYSAAQREAESWVERYFQKTAPAFMAAHLLFGVDPFFRSVVSKAMAVYDNFFYKDGDGITHEYEKEFGDEWFFDRVVGPDTPIVITTSRPGHRWAIRNGMCFDSVLNLVKEDSWCDLDMSGAGVCIDSMRRIKNDTFDYVSDTPTGPFLLPFANGNIVVLVRTCYGCWCQYTKEHKIKTKKCEIVTPIVDGFGSL